jgi:hypothetical protein
MKIPAVRFAAFALILMMAGSACTTTVREGVALQTTPDKARDRSLAKALVLSKRDFPKGWIGRRNDKANGKAGEKLEREFADCLGVSDPAKTRVASVSSPTFSNGASEVDSEVAFVRTEAIARADFAAISGTKPHRCLKQILRRELTPLAKKEGVVIASLKARTLKLPRIGDGTAGHRMTLVARGPAGTITLYSDLVAIMKERAEISLTFFGFGRPFDAVLRDRLLDRMEGRLDLI